MGIRTPLRARSKHCVSGQITRATALLIALSWTTLGCNSDSGSASQNAPQTGSDASVAKADAAAVKTVAIDRSGLTDVGTDKPLDYSDPRLWLCRPGNDPDECDANLDATELLAD